MLTPKVKECFDDQVKCLRETYTPVWNSDLENTLEKLYEAGFVFVFEADDLEYEDRQEPPPNWYSVDPYEISAKWESDRERFLASRA